MGFINEVLDEQVDYGFEGGPEYSNEVVDLENGFEYIDSAWQYARHRYSASFGNITDEDRDFIIATFHACKGRRHYFKFKDWNDYVATDQPLQVEAGTTNAVQLYKTYSFGQAYTIRPIQALKSGTVTVKSPGGSTVTGTFDYETGMFTPSSAWGSGTYSWSGEFYVWVRFDADYNSMTINSWRANTAKVELMEVKRDITATNVPSSWEE
ncbi:hypothetical protein QAY89_gp42 [Xanthomonas phage Langgrundblatt1]|uniref:DUF2460 domain-containing protein n=1 Tax=Xanthomonas phage Langgrundblatt1 TaxID=2939128 RepID=A0A9E7J529_9CAUD|nr:hypothetical protein QAY89_gp42 [Xanthomonas phage Langgrundblatt1]URA06807.1 hypothetical protein Langgrundblatt1_BL10042 [Xanthomonas phage Langgrundblatt1]